MGIKRGVRKLAKLILESSPEKNVTVNVSQINYGKILENRNIVITGGGKGIGFAIAKKCISEGANVVITGRTEETLKEATEKLGDNCKHVVFDISKVEEMKKFLSMCEEKFNGNIDSLISNAGISLHENIYKKVIQLYYKFDRPVPFGQKMVNLTRPQWT